jgi:cellulose synthase/poly-beta-1,6-N-acetylglucosamine synthase-like glycosyltransferase
MLTVLFAILAVTLFFYVASIMVLKRGIRRLTLESTREQDMSFGEMPTVSVIVAARNEADNLPRLIECLQKQDYPQDKLEICIVDDRSEDDSWGILIGARERYPYLKAIRITDVLPHFAPKKRALDRAIRETSGEILLFTDADCTPPATWVGATVASYRNDDVVVAGYSPYRFDKPTPSIIRGMLSLELFSLAAVAAGSIGSGFPLTAIGCNLSYRRKTYFAAGGFESISQWISGDDDLFVLTVARRKLGEFAYAISPGAFVPGAAPTNWKEFWHQRIRYASKGRHYPLLMTAGLVAVYLMNALIFTGSISLLLFQTAFGYAAVVAWLVKAVTEYSFLRQSTDAFRERKLLKYFLPAELIHPPYILIFAFLGLFGRFRWKDGSYYKTRKTGPAIATPDPSTFRT